LELAKIWETVYRAVMIASGQKIHRIVRKFGADMGIVAEFIGEAHEVLRDRPIYYPDYIGGTVSYQTRKYLDQFTLQNYLIL